MASYQSKERSVKGSIAILDEEPLIRCATEGLKSLCLKVGVEVMYQLLGNEVETMAGPRGKQSNAQCIPAWHRE